MAKKFAWSYSALTGFETCPKQHYHLRVKKDIREAPSEAMQWGNRVHKALEDRVKTGRPLPDSLKQHEQLCQKFVNSRGVVTTEQRLALNADLEPTEYFARDVWLRGVFDVSVKRGPQVAIFDYKTGKRKPDSEQLKLFAAIAFASDKTVEVVHTTFLWLNSKEVDKQTFLAKEEPLIWQEFEPRVSAMEEAFETNYFPARPSGLCRGWCAVKHCEHWEPRHGG